MIRRIAGRSRSRLTAALVVLLVFSVMAAPIGAFSTAEGPAAAFEADAVGGAGDANPSALPDSEAGESASADSTSEESAPVSASVRELVSEARAGEADSRFVSRSDGDVHVSVTIEAASGREEDLSDLVARHGAITSRFGGSVDAALPPDAVEEIAASPAVASIRRPAPVVSAHQGSYVSEGLPTINVSGELHDSGVNGSNVTIAVVDTGFNMDNDEIDHHVAGFKDFEDEDDGLDNETGLHGTAVAELVVDTAPNASLRLYEVETSRGMGAAIEHITRNTSADVATMSLGLLTGPFDGTSAIDGAIDDSVANGTTWFVASGNYADGQHYNQTWRDEDGDDWMDVSGSEGTIEVDADGGFDVYVSWAGADADTQDYDVYLNDSEGDVVDVSDTTQDGSHRPVEMVGASSEGTFTLAIKKGDADGTADFDLFATRNTDLRPSSSPRSVSRPATGESAVAVGAVYYGDNSLEGFSSWGPTVDGRTKPELVGPDGVKTSQSSTSGLNPFNGTSAAAPHTAGVAALVLDSVDKSIGPAELRRSLTDSATPLDTRVPNNRTGYGLVNATGAIAAAGGDGTEEESTVGSLALTGGSVVPDSAEASRTITHDVGVAFANVSADGESNEFDVTFPDAAGESDLTINGVSVTNLSEGTDVPIESATKVDGPDVPVESATKVDGPDEDGVTDTVRVAISPTEGDTIDAAVNVSVDIAWPEVDSDRNYPIATAGRDSTTGSVPLTDVASVTVSESNAPPTADASVAPTRPTVGESTTFDATGSADSDGSSETYEWTVDGDPAGEGETISYTFDAAGDHEVGLTVTDDDGATDTTSTTVAVNAPPTVALAIEPAEPTVGEAVTLDAAESSDPDGSIESYEWTVDGDPAGEGETISYTFDAAGDHEIGLTVTDDAGATARASETVRVNAPPVAAIGVSPAEPMVDETVTFDASGSTDGDGKVVTYEWDLDGDGQHDDATGVEATTSFASPDEATVGLRVNDDGGATNATTMTLTIAAEPTPDPTETVETTDTTVGSPAATVTVGATTGTPTDPSDGIATGETSTDTSGLPGTSTDAQGLPGTSTDAQGLPGFGFGVAIAALIAVVLFARRE